MQVKSVMYAVVGAPVIAARKVSGQVNTLKEKMETETTNYSKAAEKTINQWAAEGEKFISKLSEGKVVGEISAKVDFDQAKEQVSKLRDQLEDMLATWRTSFRPERSEQTSPAPETKPAAKPVAAKKPAAKTSAAKKPAAKTSAAKTTTSSAATETSSPKTPATAKSS